MQIDFLDADFANTADFLIRWYNAADNSLVYEQVFNKSGVALVAGTDPQQYRMTFGLGKPQNQPAGTQFYLTLTGKNGAGEGPASAPSATFSISAPAAPTNVVVTSPEL